MLIAFNEAWNSTSTSFIGSFLSGFIPVIHNASQKLRNFPQELMDLIEENASILEGDTRKTIVQCLTIMRNRGFIEPIPLIKLFFKVGNLHKLCHKPIILSTASLLVSVSSQLFRVQDKLLRELVFSHIVSDIKNMNHSTGTRKMQRNKKSKGLGGNKGSAHVMIPKGQTVDHINRQLQSFMYTMINDENMTAARRSLDVLIELYRRKIWTDSRTVNAVAHACLSPSARLVVPAIKFFLGVYDFTEKDDEESDEENEEAKKGNSTEAKLSKKEIAKQWTYAKRTRKRQRQAQKLLDKMRKRGKNKNISVPTFPAIQLIHDPQSLAEKMLNEVRKSTHKFEVRLMQLNMISLLVGQHKLMLLNLYSFLQRYLTAHQQHVTEVMAYLVQACHELVPPSELVPILRCIADNFVSDRCPDEVIQVGINVIRSVVAKTPSVLEEDYVDDLMKDLVEYKKHKTSKGVVMAARSLLNLVREYHPTLLNRKDRGKDHDPNARPTAYGASRSAGGISGTEVLQDQASEEDQDEETSDEEDSVTDEDNDSEGSLENDESDEDSADEKSTEGELVEIGNDEPRNEDGEHNSEAETSNRQRKNNKRQRLEATQVLTDEDFHTLKRVREESSEAASKTKKKKRRKVSPSKQSMANESSVASAGKPLSADAVKETELHGDDEESDEEDKHVEGATFSNPIEVVDPDSLEAGITLRRRAAKANAAEREKEKQQKWKPKERKGGMTNREKSRMKNYMMVRKSQTVQSKLKTSLAKQQKAIRKHLKTQSKLGKHEKKKRRRT